MINKVNATDAIYQSVRNTARITGMSEYYLRTLKKDSKLPGIMVGRKFMVNVPSLLKQFAAEEEEHSNG